jgi:hypothetical protein
MTDASIPVESDDSPDNENDGDDDLDQAEHQWSPDDIATEDEEAVEARREALSGGDPSAVP